MKSYLRTKDHAVTGEEFELVFDPSLKMLRTHPQPRDLTPYYQSASYISHSDAKETFVDKIYQSVKKFTLAQKLKMVSHFALKNKSILDVGAGTGDFLARARRDDWKISGVEPSEFARKKALEKGLTLYADFDEVVAQKFDVITLWHVLEHLPDLEDQISKIIGLLNEEGTLVIAVPNYKSYDAGYYQEFWAAYDVPRHLWHFSKVSISTLFSAHGMKVVDIRPMVFDAFYVAMLSEKYKTGKTNYLNAFCRGLYSNMKAWRTKEYSSLIYVLQKA